MSQVDYNADACKEAVIKAMTAKGHTPEQAEAIAEQAAEYFNNAAQQVGNNSDISIEDRIAQIVIDLMQRLEIAKAIQRRNTQLTIQTRMRLDGFLKKHVGVPKTNALGLPETGSKMTLKQAFMALIEGVAHTSEGARDSVAGRQAGYRAKFYGELFEELNEKVDGFEDMLQDRKANQEFDKNIFVEMLEQRDGGKPGSTGDKDAQVIAEIFAKHLERARQKLNELGAMIGKLDGYAGPQTHDYDAMIAAGQDEWVAFVRPLIDEDRMFSPR